MEKIKMISKKSLVWLTVLAVVLVGAIVLRSWTSAPELPGQDLTDGTVAGEEVREDVVPLDEEDDEAGAADDAGGDVEDDPSALIPKENVEIKELLTWDRINAFPIKSNSMSVAERRELCVEFLRFSKTALWTPDESMTYIKNGSGTVDTITKGIVYGGLPYVGVASGSVYRTMDWIDEATGMLDISKVITDDTNSGTISMEKLKYFGNQCSIGAYWGWARLMNSAEYRWTADAIPINNFIMLGDYTNFSEINTLARWTYSETKAYTNTVKACTAVGKDQMYRNYALLEKADGIVQFTTAGHIVMIAEDAVVYDTNGNRVTDLSMDNLKTLTIDPDKSYVIIVDQAQKWMDGVNAAGDHFRYKNNVDHKLTFTSLFGASYIPFTYDEFHGGIIEDTKCTFSYIGETITKSQLFKTKVTANYGISDIYLIVTDDSGEEIYRHVVRTPSAGNFSMAVKETGADVDTWGTLPSGTYNLEVAVQLGTGERPIIYVGKLVA